LLTINRKRKMANEKNESGEMAKIEEEICYA